MWLLRIVGAYVATFTLMVTIAPILEFALSPILTAVRKRPMIRNLTGAAITAAALYVAILLAFQVQPLVGVSSTWIMFCGPYALIILNDLTRKDSAQGQDSKNFHRAQAIGGLFGFVVGLMILAPSGMPWLP